MKKEIFLVTFCAILQFNKLNSLQQTCQYYDSESWEINSFDGPRRFYRECYMNKFDLLNASETVTTVLTGYSNAIDIQLVYYASTKLIKFIPNSLFATFLNLEYFMIFDNNRLEVLKPEFLKNAKKLKVFRVQYNEIKVLSKNVFREAPSLENINLRNNKIESVHKLAFHGLPQLRGVYLINNKIKLIHTTTFSHLIKLRALNLLNNVCIDTLFVNSHQEYREIEKEVGRSCKYIMDVEELAESKKKKINEALMLNKTQTLTDLNAQLTANLTRITRLNSAKIKKIQNFTEIINNLYEKESLNKIEMEKKILLVDQLLNKTNILEEKNEQLTISLTNLMVTNVELIENSQNLTATIEKLEEAEKTNSLVCQEKLDEIQKIQDNGNKLEQNELMSSFSRKMVQDLTALLQKNVHEFCLLEIQKSENTYFKSYMTMIQLVQDHKVANQRVDEEISKSCKREVAELQANIQKVSDGYEKRFKMLEIKDVGTNDIQMKSDEP